MTITKPTAIDVLHVASLWMGPRISAPALPSVPAITNDWNPYNGNNPTTMIQVIPHDNGSIIAGLDPGVAGGAAIGTIRALVNEGGTDAQGSGSLILMQDTPGNQWPFHLPARRPNLVVPSLAMVILRLDEQGKWFPMYLTDVSTPAYPRSITPAIMPTGNVNNWDPVDATTGLSFRFVNWIHLQGQIGTRLTGMNLTTPAGSRYGYRCLLTNYGSAMTIANQNSGGGTSGTTFFCPNAQDFVLTPRSSVWFVYDDVNNVCVIESSRSGGQ